MDRSRAGAAMNTADAAVVTPVQCICETNDRAELAHALAIRSIQRGIFLVAFFRQRAAVITRDVCDDGAFDFGEAGELGIQDQIQSVPLMRLMRDVITNIVQQRTGKHQRSLMTRELLDRSEMVKQLLC